MACSPFGTSFANKFIYAQAEHNSQALIEGQKISRKGQESQNPEENGSCQQAGSTGVFTPKKMGALDFLSKPFDLNVLVASIEGALKKKRRVETQSDLDTMIRV